MKCPKCGAFIEDGRTVCFMCGENLANNQQGFNPGMQNMQNMPNMQGNPNMQGMQGMPNMQGMQNNQNMQNMSNNQGGNIIDSTLNESLNASHGNIGLTDDHGFGGGFGATGAMPSNQPMNAGGFGGPGNFDSTGGFSTGGQASAPMQRNDFPAPSTLNSDPHAYKNAEIKMLANEEEDIFDFWAKHKKWIKPLLLILVLALVGFIGFKIFESKMAPEEKEPKFKSLYYEVDDSFDETAAGSEAIELAKSGSKGTDCHIRIQVGSGSSKDHASEFQQNFIKEKMPEKDEQGNAADPLAEFTTQTSSFKIRGQEWHYMNMFYREKVSADFVQLRYQLLTAVYSGYYYDITLTNNNNSNECATSLDNFTKSLEFIKSEKK